MLDVLGALLNVPRADAGWVNKPADDDYWYTSRAEDPQTGIALNEELAMSYATVYACVAKRAKTIATVPLMVYERLSDGGKRPARSHQIYRFLHDSPNDEMDAVPFWESRVANMDLWGTGYAERVYNQRDELISLKPLPSAEIVAMRDPTGELVFEQRSADGGRRTLSKRRMLWVPGLSMGGVVGMSLLRYHREAIALGIAAGRFGSIFFRQGVQFSGVIEVPKHLGDEAYRRLKETFARTNAGLQNMHGTPLLEEDAKFKQIGMPLKDAQFLELRKFQQIEICGIMDVPPHKIGILDHATFSNIEESNIQWVVDTIAPLGLRISSAVNRQLLGAGPQYFCEHVLQGLLRGDILRRLQAYGIGRQWGLYSTNDLLRMENMNPVPWGDDDHLRPLNMVPASAPYQSQDAGGSNGESAALAMLADLMSKRLSPASVSDNHRDAAAQIDRRKAFRPAMEDACRRLVAKECKAVGAAFKKHTRHGSEASFHDWLDGFYREHSAAAAQAVLPVLLGFGRLAGYGEGVAGAIAEKFAANYAVCSAAAVKGAVEAGPDRLGLEIKAWEKEKPAALCAQLFEQFP